MKHTTGALDEPSQVTIVDHVEFIVLSDQVVTVTPTKNTTTASSESSYKKISRRSR